MTFKLYPAEQPWWSFSDYKTVVDVVDAVGAKSVLEFGPGSSTLALIEGGAVRIDCLEDKPIYLRIHQQQLESRFPGVVTVIPYVHKVPLAIPLVHHKTYDLGLVDGPHLVEDRPAEIEYAIVRCTHVLVPTEDHGDIPGSFLRPHLVEMAQRLHRRLNIIETGPLAGGFALFSPPADPKFFRSGETA